MSSVNDVNCNCDHHHRPHPHPPFPPNSPTLRGRLNVYTLEVGDGRDIELSFVSRYLVWRRVGDAEWNKLISLDDITPQKGLDYWTEEDQAEIKEFVDQSVSEISHKDIKDTDQANLHPIESIKGLREELDAAAKLEVPDKTTAGNLLIYDEENKATVCEFSPTDFVLKKEISSDMKDKTYIHVQSSASSKWNISHGLKKMPSVTVVDSAGSTVVGEIKYLDLNNLIVQFTGAFSGKAYLN